MCDHTNLCTHLFFLLIKQPVQWPFHPSVYKYICSAMICTGISACGIRCVACHLWQCYMSVQLGTIKGLWAHKPNVDTILFVQILLLITMQSGHNFAYIMTAELSWHVQKYYLIWLSFFMHKQCLIIQDLDHWLINPLWNRSLISPCTGVGLEPCGKPGQVASVSIIFTDASPQPTLVLITWVLYQYLMRHCL